MALTWDSVPIRRIREASRSLGVDVLFGFIEREGEALYSSCMLVEQGGMACCCRRMSRGWKDAAALTATTGRAGSRRASPTVGGGAP